MQIYEVRTSHGARADMVELNKEIMTALQALANKVPTICQELYNTPPFPAWKDGLDELWN